MSIKISLVSGSEDGRHACLTSDGQMSRPLGSESDNRHRIYCGCRVSASRTIIDLIMSRSPLMTYRALNFIVPSSLDLISKNYFSSTLSLLGRPSFKITLNIPLSRRSRSSTRLASDMAILKSLVSVGRIISVKNSSVVGCSSEPK